MTDSKEDLFEQKDQPADQTTQDKDQHVDEADQLLDQIVDENGKRKYASVDKAVSALKASQDYIKQLEKENAQLRDSGVKEDVLEQIFKAINDGKGVSEKEPKQPATEEVSKLVEKTLQEIETKKARENNLNTVTTRVRELYGDKAGEVFYQKAKEAGFDKNDINDLARKNPNAVFKVLGIEPRKPKEPLPDGVRTDAFSHRQEKPAKSAMGHGSTDDLVKAWRDIQSKVNKKYSVE